MYHQKSPAPALVVELVAQPSRVQKLESEPRMLPRDKPSTFPSLEPNSNPWIKKIAKNKKIPQILRTKQNQASTRKFQHLLRHSPHNFGINFRTQAAHQLVANHLFKLLHDLHIYNKKGKKETIETLLMGGDGDTWWKAVGNKLRRLANGIDIWVRPTKKNS